MRELGHQFLALGPRGPEERVGVLQRLLRPVLERLGGEELRVVGDGVLELVAPHRGDERVGLLLVGREGRGGGVVGRVEVLRLPPRALLLEVLVLDALDALEARLADLRDDGRVTRVLDGLAEVEVEQPERRRELCAVLRRRAAAGAAHELVRADRVAVEAVVRVVDQTVAQAEAQQRAPVEPELPQLAHGAELLRARGAQLRALLLAQRVGRAEQGLRLRRLRAPLGLVGLRNLRRARPRA